MNSSHAGPATKGLTNQGFAIRKRYLDEAIRIKMRKDRGDQL